MRTLCGFCIRSRAAPSTAQGPPALPPRLAGLNCRLHDLEQAPGLWEAELQQTWPFLRRELKSLTPPAGGGWSSWPGLGEAFLGPGHRLGCSPPEQGPLLELPSAPSRLGLTCGLGCDRPEREHSAPELGRCLKEAAR